MIIAVDGRMVVSEPLKFNKYIMPMMSKYPIYVICNSKGIKQSLHSMGLRYKRIWFGHWHDKGVIGLSKKILKDSFFVSSCGIDMDDNILKNNKLSSSFEIEYSDNREVGSRFL